ncbi:hypothetical protein ACIBG6_07215 [Streptomyces sp. NPDC050842]|uniref:hypothetical protein n=1 Tax=Streptomyces sp. NPDC050842 TaxID=3365636 RepID=UPI0037934840
MKEERAEVLARLWEIRPEPRPEQLEADGAGLLPFAYIEGTDAYLRGARARPSPRRPVSRPGSCRSTASMSGQARG